MNGVEIWPITGWYTEIIAPYVRDQGALICPHFPKDHNEAWLRNQRAEFKNQFTSDPDLFGTPRVTDFCKGLYYYAPDAWADVILTIRNVHNWMWGVYAEEVFDSFYRILKPGGVLGLEEHRGDPVNPRDPGAKDCYVREDTVIAFAEAAGLVVEDWSKINANPRDTKDHPRGALSLPPSLLEVQDNPGPYLAIGESDRTTLRFRKPIS
jgi:predicted methyltransferase